MKIALLTANIGGIDRVVPPVPQVSGGTECGDAMASTQACHDASEMRCDYYCFTEKNLPYPLPHLSGRLQARYIKILTHRFLPDYDAYVWMDGRVAITHERFVADMVDKLGAGEVVMVKHHQRCNVYEEIDFIIQRINDGDEYLVKRYEHEPFDEERRFYVLEGLPKEVPLYSSAVFARRNEPRLNSVFDDWWLRSLEFSLFDQAMFSFVAWKHKLALVELDSRDLYDKSLVGHRHIANV